MARGLGGRRVTIKTGRSGVLRDFYARQREREDAGMEARARVLEGEGKPVEAALMRERHRMRSETRRRARERVARWRAKRAGGPVVVLQVIGGQGEWEDAEAFQDAEAVVEHLLAGEWMDERGMQCRWVRPGGVAGEPASAPVDDRGEGVDDAGPSGEAMFDEVQIFDEVLKSDEAPLDPPPEPEPGADAGEGTAEDDAFEPV